MAHPPRLADSDRCRALLAQVGGTDVTALSPARLRLHWALQPVASVGFTLLDPAEDFSHTTLFFRSGRLQTRPTSSGVRAALLLEEDELAVLEEETIVERQPIAGATLDDLYNTMHRWVSVRGCADHQLARPTHDLPDHPVSTGAAFEPADDDHTAELCRWFRLGFEVVCAVADAEPRAGEVMMWPHHFDTATLIALGGDRTVGVGYTPGDSGYPQPYFYVTPWPYPEGSDLPPLAGGGHWHQEGWTGAVLTGEAFLSTPPEQRVDALDRFLRSALDATIPNGERTP
jgi:hypothetical protein